MNDLMRLPLGILTRVGSIGAGAIARQPHVKRSDFAPRVYPRFGRQPRRNARQVSVARTKHMMPSAGVQQTTARPTGLSIRCKTLSLGTMSHRLSIKTS